MVRAAGVALAIGLVAWMGGGTGVEAQNSRNDISSEARSILDLLLLSVPVVKEYIDETNLGPPHLFISRRHDLVMINSSEGVHSLRILNATKLSSIIATDYDPVEDFLYWSTPSGIFRAHMNNTGEDLGEHHTVYSGKGVEGIAVDWIARNIYMTDDVNSRIAISRHDGKYLKTLVDKGIENPRGIVVDPEVGKVFWSEWGSNPRIASAFMDGSDVRTIVADKIKWPNGLAVDSYRKLIYFGDASLDTIAVVNMDGTERKTITDQGIEHIFGLCYLGGNLYFTDWRSNTVVRLSVSDPSKRSTLLTTANQPFGIKATYLDPIAIRRNPCATDNGGCSHLCLFTGKDITCGCPDIVSSNSSVTISTPSCFESKLSL